MEAESDPAKKAQLNAEWDLHKIKAENSYQNLNEDATYAKSHADTDLWSREVITDTCAQYGSSILQAATMDIQPRYPRLLNKQGMHAHLEWGGGL